ncbi:unnamed protein product [Parascedosporium putredinis]|uniref:UBX domain-containing protein 2 n=1 Tax=Parascedosporium putredinis TaxID=1442378 RepID=A0A9P1GUU2_9PEZI|nr:unnamed protein product [Parascedosporium putredinis]CAI7988057.1 unnamed protein product [Parascedosporium putredinis]
MFFQGSLQEALASAVQAGKAVACFVTDDGEESKSWENDFLTQESISELITSNAVVLRLKAGSQEAGYLAAIFPVPKVPTLVILRNGQLKEYLAAGTTKDDFATRPRLERPAAQQAASSQSRAPASNPRPQSAAPSTTPTQPTAARGSQKKALEAYARKAKGKGKAEPDADDGEKYRTPEQKRLAEEIKKKQKEALEERKRIMQRIEADKADRRAAREALVREPTSGDIAANVADAPATKLAKTSTLTALMVRLHDGTTLRSRFPNSATLQTDIRKWVDENRTGDRTEPYLFRVTLSPTSTMPPAPEGGNFVAWLYALILSFFSSLFGAGTPAATRPEEIEMSNLGPQQQDRQGQPQARSTGARVQTLHDAEQRRRRDHQLYNGNSLNFEPRPEDEE